MKKKCKIDYDPRLYRSDELTGKSLLWLKRRADRALPGYTVFALAQNEQDQLDLIGTGMLRARVYEGRTLRVVGMAKGEEDARTLLVRMMDDCLAARGDCNLREYFG